MQFVENIIPALHRFVQEGLPTALVTLINIDGSSPRPVGSQLGVAADGRSVGMITGGCAEKAIITEALRCLEENKNKTVRYGAGSPYLDVILPCGSGIDLYIEVRNSAALVGDIHGKLSRRLPAFMEIDPAALTATTHPEAPAVSSDRERDDVFVKIYDPDYRLYCFGEGANLIALCLQAQASGVSARAFSPDEAALEYLRERGISVTPVHAKSDFTEIPVDAHTAIVTLFHEHDWETEILRAALNSNADYIGALGSRATHAARLEKLEALRPMRRDATIIRGPVGLDIGAKNPNEIAISIIAEIIAHRRSAIK